MSEANVELARQGLENWNRGDVGAMLGASLPDFEFIPAVAATVEGGSVRGEDAFRRFFESLDETWESFKIEGDENAAIAAASE